MFVAIATWEADPDRFARQLESLRAQTYTNWVGAVVDDGSSAARREATAALVAKEPRLKFVSYTARLGFYRNFERALVRAPKDISYVALCDQDDVWHSQKLARQLARLDEDVGAQLCYSDLRLVDDAGGELAASFWHGRPHQSSFRSVLYNNVVTGATALFRRGLLDRALPFPADGGGAFHDHWLALCALATGGLSYIDEPLVDYRQHAGNALGAQTLSDAAAGAGRTQLFRTMREAMTHPAALLDRLDALAAHADKSTRRLGAFAQALTERIEPLPPEVADALQPLEPAPTLGMAARLGRQALTAGLDHDETNLEAWKIPLGIAWAKLKKLRKPR